MGARKNAHSPCLTREHVEQVIYSFIYLFWLTDGLLTSSHDKFIQLTNDNKNIRQIDSSYSSWRQNSLDRSVSGLLTFGPQYEMVAMGTAWLGGGGGVCGELDTRGGGWSLEQNAWKRGWSVKIEPSMCNGHLPYP